MVLSIYSEFYHIGTPHFSLEGVSDVSMCHSWHQAVCQQLFWDGEKLNFSNKLISDTFSLLGLLEISDNGSRLIKTNFVLSLADWDYLSIFSESFSEKRKGFIFLLRASRTCSVPRQEFIFLSYLLPSQVEFYRNSQNFPLFQNTEEKNFIMMTSIVRLSSNRL